MEPASPVRIVEVTFGLLAWGSRWTLSVGWGEEVSCVA